MKKIIKKLAALLFSDKAFIIFQTLAGMYAVEQERYTVAYGIGILTIINIIRDNKSN